MLIETRINTEINCIIELKINVLQKIIPATLEQKLLREEIFLSLPKP